MLKTEESTSVVEEKIYMRQIEVPRFRLIQLTSIFAVLFLVACQGAAGQSGQSSSRPSGILTYTHLFRAYQFDLSTNTAKIIIDDIKWAYGGRNGEVLYSQEKIAPSGTTMLLNILNSDGLHSEAYDQREKESVFTFAHLALSNDGSKIAYVNDLSENTVVRDRKTKKILATYSGSYWPKQWTNDDRLLLWYQDATYLTGQGGGEPIQRIDDASWASHPENPDISQDGKYLAFDANDQIWIADFDGQRFVKPRQIFSGAKAPVWSPDGQWLAVVLSGTFTIQIISPDGKGQPSPLLNGNQRTKIDSGSLITYTWRK